MRTSIRFSLVFVGLVAMLLIGGIFTGSQSTLSAHQIDPGVQTSRAVTEAPQLLLTSTPSFGCGGTEDCPMGMACKRGMCVQPPLFED